MEIYSVYILLSGDNTYYTGITSNLSKRLAEHISSRFPNSYTSNRLPVELVYYVEFIDVQLAIDAEKQIKKWSRLKKEALINNEFEKLPNLSKKKYK
jgi:putative endonuclease